MKKIIMIGLITGLVVGNNLEAGVIIKKDSNKLVLPLNIKNKSDESFIFEQLYSLKHGLAQFKYQLIAADNPENILTIYEGQTFSDAETCPSEEDIILERATISREYFIEDLNADGVSDILFKAKEMDCKSREISFVERRVLATEDSFEIK